MDEWLFEAHELKIIQAYSRSYKSYSFSSHKAGAVLHHVHFSTFSLLCNGRPCAFAKICQQSKWGRKCGGQRVGSGVDPMTCLGENSAQNSERGFFIFYTHCRRFSFCPPWLITKMHSYGQLYVHLSMQPGSLTYMHQQLNRYQSSPIKTHGGIMHPPSDYNYKAYILFKCLKYASPTLIPRKSFLHSLRWLCSQ